MKQNIDFSLKKLNEAQKRCCREVEFLTNASAELVPGFLETYSLLDEQQNRN